MAKVQHFENAFSDYGSTAELTFNAKHTRAVYTYESGAEIIFTGERLKGTEGGFTKGSYDKVVFRDAEGAVALSVTGGQYNAKDFDPADISFDAYAFYLTLLGKKDIVHGGDGDDYLEGMNGADRIFGGKGEDTLLGGNGDDVLSGGAGIDTFYVSPTGKNDNDTITDLDIQGNVVDELQIATTIDKVTRAHRGEDTLITFTNKATLLLEGIERADFMEFWTN